MPKISVIMSAYNGAANLRPALESILAQSWHDFEFIVIDDASTDDSLAILNSYGDPRLILLQHEHNQGLTRSLNAGLAIAQGDYIARMDADDISLPDRLAKQLAYLEQHRQVTVVGANISSIDANGAAINNGKPQFGEGAQPQTLRWELLWSNPLPHMTIMFRREADIHYDPMFEVAQDYELWSRLAKRTALVRLPDVLVKRRIESTSITSRNRTQQLAFHGQIMRRELSAFLGEEIPETALQTMLAIVADQTHPTPHFVGATNLLLKAYRRFRSETLAPDEQDQIQRSAVRYLLKISKYARSYSKQMALYPLWRSWQISPRDFFSRQTVDRISQVVRGT